jgi:tetratricopeptide (TPR) repeat protein
MLKKTSILFYLLLNIFFGYSQSKNVSELINSTNLKINYSFNSSNLEIIVQTIYSPTIYIDVNQNYKIDSLIDRGYSYLENYGMCSSFLINQNGVSTTCGQNTLASVKKNQNIYTFLIPLAELSIINNNEYYLSFGLWDGKNNFHLPTIDNENFYIIKKDELLKKNTVETKSESNLNHLQICNFSTNKFINSSSDIKLINNGEDCAIINRILKVMDLSLNFNLIRIKNFNNAVAFISNNGVRYIGYDEKFIKEIVNNSNDYSRIGIFAHEIGHHFYNHILSKTNDLNELHKMELEADYFAGKLLSLYGATEDKAIKFIELLKDVPSSNSTHPSKEFRLLAVKNGYNSKTNLINKYSENNECNSKNELMNTLQKDKNNVEELLKVSDYIINNNCKEKAYAVIVKAYALYDNKRYLEALKTNSLFKDFDDFFLYDCFLIQRANILSQLSRFKEAEFAMQQISPLLHTLDGTYYYNYALLLNDMGKYEKAKYYYEKAIQIGGYACDTYGNLAILYRDKLKNPNKALSLLNNYLKYGKPNSDIYNILGVTYSLYKNDYNKGLFYSNQAINLNPNNCKYFINRGLNYYYLNNLKSAYEDLKNCANSNDNEFANQKLNEIKNKLKIKEQNVGENENSSNTNYGIGKFYNEQRNYDSALFYLKKSLKLFELTESDFTLNDVYIEIGIAFNGLNQYKDAILAFKKSIAKNSKVDNRAYMYLGFIYSFSKYGIQLGGNSLGINYYKKAVEINPSDGRANYELSIAYKNFKNNKLFKYYFDKAVKINPYFLEIYKNRNEIINN